jgi:cysteine desulfurase
VAFQSALFRAGYSTGTGAGFKLSVMCPALKGGCRLEAAGRIANFRMNDRMEPKRAYLDHNATAPLRPAAELALIAALKLPGNASSVHGEGRAARAEIDRARDVVAALVGAKPANVVFTSGGTEAAAMALRPGIRKEGAGQGADLLLIGATEHPCILLGHGFQPESVETIPVDQDGVVELERLAERIRLHQAQPGAGPALVSVQLANNETGGIQPVAEIASLAHAHGALVHCDAVQALGRIPVDMPALGVDALSLSAHKMGGPKGVGALILADGVTMDEPLIRGGGQERSRRAGTENIPAIAGFGAAAREIAGALSEEGERMARLRDQFEAGLMAIAPDATIFGRDAPRLPNTSCFALPAKKAQEMLILLDLAGVSVSSGAACSSGKVSASHVLKAMGVADETSACALRLSLGWSSGEADIELALQGFAKTLSRRKDEGRAAA